jgi:hypothetical protein
MYLTSNNTLKFFCSIKPKFGSTIIRTLFNPFAPKPIEKATDAHSNALADSENVFELQHHTVKPSSMVNKVLSGTHTFLFPNNRYRNFKNKTDRERYFFAKKIIDI